MDHPVKISVIVPAYNVALWLERCMDSILSQTYPHLEVLLIDDGSTDETPRIADRIAQRDPRVWVIHQANAGLVAVREKGIALATGDYVSFVDGDDVIEPDFLARLLANAIKYQADISHCGMKFCFYDGRVKLHYGTGEIVEFDTVTGVNELLWGGKIEPSLCNKLYRRELLADSCPDTSVVNNEDLLRNFVLFSRAGKSVFEDFCGYQYWRRAESMSNNGFQPKRCRDILRVRSLILENASAETMGAATQSYANALISSYNAAIGVRTEDAIRLRRHCKNALKQLNANLRDLPRGLYLRAAAILYIPGLYHGLHRIHEANIRRKIKAAAAAQKES